jgi:quinol monooxygenase YgiN
MVFMTLEINVTVDQRIKALGAFRQVAGPLEVQPGCLTCRILTDVRTEGVIGLVVVWDTQENLERHIRSDLFWKVLALMETSSGKPEIRFHTVSRTTGLESVEKIRGAGHKPHSKKNMEGGAPAPRNR